MEVLHRVNHLHLRVGVRESSVLLDALRLLLHLLRLRLLLRIVGSIV